MKKIVSFLSICMVIVSSCKKETVDLGVNSNGTDGLSNTTWRITSSISQVELTSSTTFEYDLFTSIEACLKDNTVTYNANGTVTGDEGPTKCDPSSPQTQTAGSWKLSGDKKKFSITSPPNANGISSLDAEVLQLDSKVFTIRYITYLGGPKSTTTTSYTRVK